MFITLTHPSFGKIRINFSTVSSYFRHPRGSVIRFNFATSSSSGSSQEDIIVSETPEQIDILLHAVKK